MSKCKDCRYALSGAINLKKNPVTITTCTLTSVVVLADKENECPCFNLDLTPYDICYNCKYYLGGGDWGLFCSHEDMYHHLGKFSDDPCERYEKKE